MRLSVFSSSGDAKIAAVIWWNGKLTLLLHRHSSNAFLAQLVERLIRNEQVVGSSPMKGSSEALKAIALNAFLFPLIYSFSMTDLYKTIESPAEGFYKAKGSKFLSFALPVRSADEVKERVKAYRKEYYDARHCCYAYMLGSDRTVFRANDNGEPMRPRYLAADGGKVYMTYYYGHAVAVLDTASLEVERVIPVGRYPEQIVISNNRLYVANSGGLDYPNYGTTVSVIDLYRLEVEKEIEVKKNARNWNRHK